MPGKKYEILAPAGSPEALSAAVRSGADAVYFGLTDFSARRNAENFTPEQMREALRYCRRSGVRGYITLNTAIKQKELSAAVCLAKQAYLAGVDGFIVSDLGLARMIRESFPDVELHASTQMTVNSAAALDILKELGFCRVVAAREMSRGELKVFCKRARELDIEVEVFVHGALCMSVSGQCLMSSVLGGRSGNRGLCAGPCRLPFSVEGGTGHDLSLKDLSLLSHIGELIDMGVYSFKIEGRMKRPEYIAAAVTACRAAAGNPATDNGVSDMLEKVFSRSGFTDGYFTGETGIEMFGVRSDADIEKSKEVHSALHDLYRNEYQRIPLSVKARIKKDEPIYIGFSSGEKKVFAMGEVAKEAKTKALTKEDVAALLSRLGGTPFYAESVDISLDGGLFVPAGEINRLRRECCEDLSGLFEEVPKRRCLDIAGIRGKNRDNAPVSFYARFESAAQIPDDLSGVELVILPLENCEATRVETAVELPKLIGDEARTLSRLRALKNGGITKAVCPTLSAVSLARKCEMEIMGDIGLNVMNAQSAGVLSGLGAIGITLSAEIDARAAAGLAVAPKKGIFGYGRLPLMTVVNCPVKNGKTCGECGKRGRIVDRLGVGFPILCRGKYSEILNSKPLYIADRLSQFEGVDYVVLSFTTESREECGKIIKDCISGRPPESDFTRGLYFKEVL